jgi:hypothetical protein
MISALRPRGPNVPASRWAPASVRFASDNPKALVCIFGMHNDRNKTGEKTG